METLYKVIELSGVFVSFACCAVLMRARYSVNTRNLMLTCLCGFIACMGNALEAFSQSPDGALVAVKMAYIGKCCIMVSGLMFVSGYSSVKLPKNLTMALGLANALILASVMACERHSLFYSSIGYETGPGGRVFMLLGKGPLYYVWIGLLMMTALLYIILAWHEKKRGSRIARMRTNLIFAAVASPLAAAVFALSGRPAFFDPATPAIVASLICFLAAAGKYGLLDTLELAGERVMEEARDGIVIVDNTRSVILYANPAAEKFLEQIAGESGGPDIGQLTDKEEAVCESGGKRYEIRVSQIRRETGSGGVQGYAVWIFDMACADQFASDVMRLREEAAQANKAKTEFLAQVSHEIRTPMNSIVGYAEMALRTKEDDLARRYIRNIKESSSTLLHLINEILDISRIETGRMEIVKVNYQFSKMIGRIRSAMEEQAGNAQLSFRMEIDSQIPDNLYGDRMKLEAAVSSLLNNGIKYTREGSVTLRVRMRDNREDRVLLYIEVEDTGIGIRQEDTVRIFDEFDRPDSGEICRAGEGSLGLPVVRGFIRMMGGDITFESEYGKGTKFIVTLWQEKGSRERCTGQGESAEDGEPAIKSGRILIVDDNELNCEVASGIMELLGMRTRTARSGLECMELLESGERFDIIFMDHMMPEMDGVETMKLIRRMFGETEDPPVVLLTANAIAGVREQMLRQGFDDFMPKPIDVDELRRVLAKYLGFGRE